MQKRCLSRAGVALLILVVAGCASYDDQTVSRRPTEIIDPPRSDRGNPNSYEVFGQRYFVMQSADGYRDTGVASWYGPDFQGNETSSGERYDMYGLTAAHKTLPIPTWVEVTNRGNGRRVIVKVNDRGPFVDGRIIDLSYAAALQIGMVRDGTAPVFVRALGAPGNFPTHMDREEADRLARQNQAAETPVSLAGSLASSSSLDSGTSLSSALAESGTFMQVGAFSLMDNAMRMMDRLRENGFIKAVLVAPGDAGSGLHLVRVGPLIDGAEIDLVSEGLRLIGIEDTHLIRVP